MVVGGHSQFLATQPIHDQKVATVAAAIHSIMMADQGSEFTSINNRTFLESLRVKLEFILAGEHQNLVE